MVLVGDGGEKEFVEILGQLIFSWSAEYVINTSADRHLRAYFRYVDVVGVLLSILKLGM